MDRTTIAWTGAQLDVIGQLGTYGKPVVVLQMGTNGVDSTPLMSNPNISALVWGGYPGMDGGRALFDIVQGKVAPAGRLPTTRTSTSETANDDLADEMICRVSSILYLQSANDRHDSPSERHHREPRKDLHVVRR